MAAILASDMVGYSRLMEADEAGTVARQKRHFEQLVRPSIERDNGRIVKLTGQTAGVQATARRVAATLGVNLSARKAAQFVPFVGAAIGAGVNVAFQNDVAAAARHAYRERWLAVNEGVIRGELADAT